jgi:hypothetical protein
VGEGKYPSLPGWGKGEKAMSGLKQLVERQYLSKFDTLLTRQVIYPVTGLGAGTGLGAVCTAGAALTWGVWQDVALPALIAVENYAFGVIIDTPSAIDTHSVEIGSTFSLGVVYANAAAVNAAGAAVVLGAARAQAARQQYIAIAAVLGPAFIPLAVPVWYGPGHGILARVSSIAGGTTLNVSVACVTGM